MDMWAFVDPNGRVVADPEWKGPMDAWAIGLDYPPMSDVAAAQLKGYRVTWISIRFHDGSRCGHGIRDGEWCEACRDAVREAGREADREQSIRDAKDDGNGGNGSETVEAGNEGTVEAGNDNERGEAGNENERGRASDRVAGKNPCDVGAKRDDRDLYEGLMN